MWVITYFELTFEKYCELVDLINLVRSTSLLLVKVTLFVKNHVHMCPHVLVKSHGHICLSYPCKVLVTIRIRACMFKSDLCTQVRFK